MTSTMMDVGLETGARDAWQQGKFTDYTIVAEDQEFKVHKVVLAAVSDYFRAMLTSSLLESKSDRVELPGVSAHGLSKTLEFVYTGEKEVMAANIAEIRKCAVYFQMPKLIALCKRRVHMDMTAENCIDLLSTSVLFSDQSGVDKAKHFMRYRGKSMLDHCKYEEVTYECLELMLESLEVFEWDRFSIIQKWVDINYEHRKLFVNDLMSQMRFCLIGPNNITAIQKMNIYTDADGAWHELVKEAVEYHKLPTHQKMLVNSKQAEVRKAATSVIIPSEIPYPTLALYTDEGSWREVEELKVPKTLRSKPIVITVNNFLIMHEECGSSGSYRWHIFDPRSLAWSEMSCMETTKAGFALIHHKDHLYAIGGLVPLQDDYPSAVWLVTDDVQEYSIKTNTWRTITKTPIPVANHAACVLGDAVYVTGGMRKVGHQMHSHTVGMDCLDVSTSTWYRKAEMKKGRENHKMVVIKPQDAEVILVIDDQLEMELYTPSTGQWSVFKPKFSNRDIAFSSWDAESAVLFRGNSLYFHHVNGSYDYEWYSDEESDEDTEDRSTWKYERLCVYWDFSDNKIDESVFCPYLPDRKVDLSDFGVVLALSAR